ncbi:hypothetical protein DENSPDRAFT_900038 [Dentipellis sp. KUC8613]|nr:hypothetical protein DENSPDRAFT_900038 [Dentipellis sp. KUC8613]
MDAAPRRHMSQRGVTCQGTTARRPENGKDLCHRSGTDKHYEHRPKTEDERIGCGAWKPSSQERTRLIPVLMSETPSNSTTPRARNTVLPAPQPTAQCLTDVTSILQASYSVRRAPKAPSTVSTARELAPAAETSLSVAPVQSGLASSTSRKRIRCATEFHGICQNDKQMHAGRQHQRIRRIQTDHGVDKGEACRPEIAMRLNGFPSRDKPPLGRCEGSTVGNTRAAAAQAYSLQALGSLPSLCLSHWTQKVQHSLRNQSGTGSQSDFYPAAKSCTLRE